jgi:pimeloyl-ACP methyl ester carboxylesterase
MERGPRFELSPEITLEQQWEQGGFLFHFGKEQDLPSDVDVEVRVLDAQVDKGGVPKETVFVVGGAGEDLDVMKPFLLSLAKQGVQVVGVSMPSYGHSSDADHRWRVGEGGKDKTDFADYSTLIHSVHTHLQSDKHPVSVRKPGEKIHIVGHSLGGSMVADFATRRPEEVASVHLVAPAGMDQRYTLPGLRLPPFLFMEFVAAHFKERLPKIFDLFKGKDLPPVIKNLWGKSFMGTGGLINTINELESRGVEPRMIQRFWEGKIASKGNLKEQLVQCGEQHIPTIVYACEDDALFPPNSYDTLSEADTQVKIMQDAAHYGILDMSDTFAKEIVSSFKQSQS